MKRAAESTVRCQAFNEAMRSEGARRVSQRDGCRIKRGWLGASKSMIDFAKEMAEAAGRGFTQELRERNRAARKRQKAARKRNRP